MKKLVLIFTLMFFFSSKTAASTLFSIQLYTAQNYKYAKLFLKKIPAEIRKDAFVYKTDSGLYTVRIYPEKSVKILKKKLKYLKSLGINSLIIVKTDPHKIPKRKTSKNLIENLLTLLYQTYLANGKLNKALLVALKGTKLFPNNPYWWKKIVQVSRWLGKNDLRLKALEKLVFEFKNYSFLKELYSVALANQKFDVAVKAVELSKKLKKHPFSTKEIMLLLYATENPQEYIEKILPLVKDSSKALREIVYIYWSQGNLKDAEKLLRFIMKNFQPTPKDFLTLASILFAEKKFQESLQVLKEAFKRNITDNELLINLSDLAWTLGDFKTAVIVSKKLISSNIGRKEDYLRLINYYYYIKPEKALSFALKGWKKFKDDIFLPLIFELAVATKKDNLILEIVSNLPKLKKNKLLKNPSFLSLYSYALFRAGKRKEAENLLEHALKKHKQKELISQYIYFLLESKDIRKLEKTLREYRSFSKEIPEAFISAYLFLQNGKEAFKLLRQVKLDKRNYNLLLIKADILELIGKENEAYKIRKKVLSEVKKLIKTRQLSKSVVISYLRTLMYFSNPSFFEREFEKYKRYISKEVANDIYYSYLLTKGEFGKLLYRKKHRLLKAWIKLSLALLKEDLYTLNYLTNKFLPLLPIRDRVTALNTIKKPGKALNIAFVGLEKNYFDNRLFRQFRDITVMFKSHCYLEVSYQKRSSSQFLFASNNLKLKVANSLFSRVKVQSWFLTDRGSVFSKSGLYSNNAKLYLEKLNNTSNISIGFLLNRNNRNSETGLFISAKLKGPHNSEFNTAVFSGAPTDVSELAILTCTKRGVQANFSIPFNNRLGVFTSAEKSFFNSTRGEEIGKGMELYGEITYRLRAGYPDYTLRTYIQRAIYNETKHRNTLPDEVSKFIQSRVLPQSYSLIGIGLNFGSENRESFVRVWRPFFGADLSYSTSYGWGTGFIGGIGGSLFGRDNFHLQINFYRGFEGRGVTGVSLQGGYRRWF